MKFLVQDRRRRALTAIGLLLAFIAAGPAHSYLKWNSRLFGRWEANPSAAGPVAPDTSWTYTDPEKVGLNPKKLRLLADHLEGRGAVVRDGYMAFTWGPQSKPMDIASASKVFFGIFLALAVEEKLLDSFDTRVADFEPCLLGLEKDFDHKSRDINFRQLANMTSGYGTTDLPGQAFNYSDWQAGLLSQVLFLKVFRTNNWMDADQQVFQGRLGHHLQFEDAPTLLAFGPMDRPGRIAISVRDLARVGLLFLHNGRWHGKSILSSESIKLLTASPLPVDLPRTRADATEVCPGIPSFGSQTSSYVENQTHHRGGYSWMWWINAVDSSGAPIWPDAPADTYLACGHSNCKRALVVIPSLRMVVVWNDTSLDEKAKNTPDSVDPSVVNAALKLVVDAAL